MARGRESLSSHELLFLLSRHPRDLADPAAGPGLETALALVDAASFAGLCTAHATYPLVYENLRRAAPESGKPIIRRLEPHYHASVRNGLVLTHALFEVLDALAGKGVETVCYKGPVLAVDGYGDLRRRVFGDLDLFVDVDDVRSARDVLLGMGCTQIDPLPEVLRATYASRWPLGHPHGNAVGFSREAGTDSQVDVDLQWGVAPHYLKVPVDPRQLLDRTRAVDVRGRPIRTFSSADTLILMCLHGAKHAWEELRQIVDVAVCLPAAPDYAWDEVIRRIADWRLVRTCALAFRLAESVAGRSLPVEVRSILRNDREDRTMRGLEDGIRAWRFEETSRRRHPMQFAPAVRFHLQSRDRAADGLGSLVFHAGGVMRRFIRRGGRGNGAPQNQ